MTTPADDEPQPRDIVLEQATPEQVQELEDASGDDDHDSDQHGGADGGPG